MHWFTQHISWHSVNQVHRELTDLSKAIVFKSRFHIKTKVLLVYRTASALVAINTKEQWSAGAEHIILNVAAPSFGVFTFCLLQITLNFKILSWAIKS